MGSVTGARLRAFKKEKERLEKMARILEARASYDTDHESFELAEHKNMFRLLAKATAIMFIASALIISVAVVAELTRPGSQLWITTQNGIVVPLSDNLIR